MKEKIQILKESYFGTDVSESPVLTEEGSSDSTPRQDNPSMNHYMSAISRHSDSNKMI